jgi:hypothetical protein
MSDDPRRQDRESGVGNFRALPGGPRPDSEAVLFGPIRSLARAGAARVVAALLQLVILGGLIRSYWCALSNRQVI